ncbi:MAG: pyridoxal phosphate-dependent aminotransferase [Phycisphaerales bacterium]|jgi:aspartate aminotransferase|nr:pyridoxal phosphate-dependent aminotransferase [Phycisphaerales bacterium]
MNTTTDTIISRRAAAIKPSSTLAITARVRAMKAEGHDIIGFGAGEPDFTTPDPVCEAAVNAIRAGMTRYVPVPGIPEARAAVAQKLRAENAIDCEPDQIIISNGGKFSLYLAIQAIIDPGDEVIMPTPAWVSYQPMVELAGGNIVEVPTTAESGFLAAPEDFAAAITPRTRAVILNSPSNPCGTMYDPDAIRAICDVLSSHDRITLISDEIYERLVYGGREHLSPASLPSMSGKTITINGLSKAFAATGWRVGYACAPASIVKAMSKLQSQMTSSVASFTLPALVTALESCSEEVDRMRGAFERRAALMEQRVSVWPGVTCPPPMGAFYVFPDVSSAFGRTSAGGRTISDAGSFAESLLEEAGVAVVPGDDFLGCGPNHVRLSFALDEASIEDGCSRTGDWLGRLT